MKQISARNMRSYREQYWYAENVLTQFLELSHTESLAICEVGPAEGGVLRYFVQMGHQCFGIEYSSNRHENSLILNKELNIEFVQGDITDSSSYIKKIPRKLDIIICRDVIEHIEQNKKLIALQNKIALLKPGGKCFISFPPKYSPYAGHQQTAPSAFAKLPYIYFLPDKIYSLFLRMTKVPKPKINGLMRVKSTRLSIRKFEKMVKQISCSVDKRKFFLIRPSHENRYKLKRLGQPFHDLLLREILSTGVLYCLIKK